MGSALSKLAPEKSRHFLELHLGERRENSEASAKFSAEAGLDEVGNERKGHVI